MAVRLFHFSDDPDIRRFTPHVPRTNPSQPAQVWAIDEHHQSLYWFPRECPRVTVWPRPDEDGQVFSAVFDTTAPRLHALEVAWFDRFAAATIHRYELPAPLFRPWSEATGQWVSTEAVEPLGCESLTGLAERHAAAAIELRVLPSLWPLVDIVTDPAHVDDWDFSIVRLANAAPRLSQ